MPILNLKENKTLRRLANVILLFLLVVSFFVIYFNTSLIENSKKDSQVTQSTTKSLTNSTVSVQEKSQQFSSPSNVNVNISDGVSSKFTGVSELKNINNDDTVITFNSASYKNINNVIPDILNGLAITDQINVNNCVDLDQLAINYQSKTCQAYECYNRFGNKVPKGNTIEEIVLRPGVAICKNQNLGYLSFNFNLNAATETISKESLFFTIERAYVGTNVFKELKSEENLKYYFERNLFIEDSYIGENDIIPRIIHTKFSKNDYRQKIVVQKFDSSGTSTSQGNLAELVFRPGQLFLDADTDPGGITSINNNGTINNSNLTNNYTIRTVKQNNNTTAKCILHPEGVYIFEAGNGYNNTDNVVIEGDDGIFTGSFPVNTNSFTRNLRLKRRKNYSDKDRAVWLLAPPTNFTPEGITKKNKVTNGYMIDFSTESPVNRIKEAILSQFLPPYIPVAPGTVISPVAWQNITKTIGGQMSSNDCQNIKDTSLDNFFKSCDLATVNGLAVGVYDKYKFLFDSQVQDNISIQKSSFNFNTEIYDTYPPYLLESVSKFPAYANPNFFTNRGAFYITVADYKNDFDFGATDLEAFAGAFALPYPTVTQLKSDTILDGDVEWQQTNTFQNTLAFRENYFLNSPLDDGQGKVTTVSDITEENLKFIEPTIGKISEINIIDLNYGDVDLPSFDSSRIVNLNTTTLTASGGASVGEDASALVSFIAQGTSTIINSFQIISPGKNFKTGTFSLLASGISAGLSGSINNLQITSEDDVFLFEAVATDLNSGNPISSLTVTETLNFNINYGLTVDLLENNTLNLEDPTIIQGGYGYKATDKIYINQYSENGSVFGASFNQDSITLENMQKLPYLNVVNAADTGVSFFVATPRKLFPDNPPSQILYNFWEDSTGVYDLSPQQIIYYGDFVKDTNGASAYIGDPSKDLLNFFLSNKIDDSAFTNIEFLSSLQIPSYDYTTSGISSIPSYEGLQLKRFIPYSKFTPPVKTGNQQIPTVRGTSTYYNYNYCQLIPYGIENVYNYQFSNESDLPSF